MTDAVLPLAKDLEATLTKAQTFLTDVDLSTLPADVQQALKYGDAALMGIEQFVDEWPS